MVAENSEIIDPEGFGSRTDLFGYGLSASCSSGQLMNKPDRHQELEINYLSEGTLTYLMGSTKITLPKRQLFFFWGSVPHQVVTMSNVHKFYWIHLPLSWVLRWALPQEFVQRLMQGTIIAEPDPDMAQHDEASVALWVNDITGKSLEHTRIALLEIEARLRRLALCTSHNPVAAPLEQKGYQASSAMLMARYIGENYTTDLRIPRIAEYVSLNPEYAMTLFRKEFGMTITKFINRHRIWHAQRILATTNAKVLSIALDSGFGSLSQFNAVFKEISTVSPREFRRRLASNF